MSEAAAFRKMGDKPQVAWEYARPELATDLATGNVHAVIRAQGKGRYTPPTTCPACGQMVYVDGKAVQEAAKAALNVPPGYRLTNYRSWWPATGLAAFEAVLEEIQPRPRGG